MAPVTVGSPEKKDFIEKTFLFIFTTVIILLMFFMYDYLDDWRAKQIRETPDLSMGTAPGGAIISCTDLGCPRGTKYTASKNSNIYHGCNCFYAKTILPGNRLCFSSQEEAIVQGYKPGSCL